MRNERRVAFVISAFFLGVAGGLYAQFLGNLTPGTIYLDITFLTLAMLVVGGIHSLSGAVLGSVFISVVAEILRRAEGGFDLGFIEFAGRSGVREVGLALVLLGVLLWRPEGIVGGREIALRRRRPPTGETPPARAWTRRQRDRYASSRRGVIRRDPPARTTGELALPTTRRD